MQFAINFEDNIIFLPDLYNFFNFVPRVIDVYPFSIIGKSRNRLEDSFKFREFLKGINNVSTVNKLSCMSLCYQCLW